ncbi:hypothetical protein Tco_0869195 [Tanacetum coccineum]
MITNNNRIEGKKLSGLMLPPQLKTKGTVRTKGQPLEATCSQLWRERTLQKSVSKSKQQYPWESILADGQERSPRSERSHGYVSSKPTSS